MIFKIIEKSFMYGVEQWEEEINKNKEMNH